MNLKETITKKKKNDEIINIIESINLEKYDNFEENKEILGKMISSGKIFKKRKNITLNLNEYNEILKCIGRKKNQIICKMDENEIDEKKYILLINSNLIFFQNNLKKKYNEIKGFE